MATLIAKDKPHQIDFSSTETPYNITITIDPLIDIVGQLKIISNCDDEIVAEVFD